MDYNWINIGEFIEEFFHTRDLSFLFDLYEKAKEGFRNRRGINKIDFSVENAKKIHTMWKRLIGLWIIKRMSIHRIFPFIIYSPFDLYDSWTNSFNSILRLINFKAIFRSRVRAVCNPLKINCARINRVNRPIRPNKLSSQRDETRSFWGKRRIPVEITTGMRRIRSSRFVLSQLTLPVFEHTTASYKLLFIVRTHLWWAVGGAVNEQR